MAKLAREQAVRDRRARKQQKKDDKKFAAAADAKTPASPLSDQDANAESPHAA